MISEGGWLTPCVKLLREEGGCYIPTRKLLRQPNGIPDIEDFLSRGAEKIGYGPFLMTSPVTLGLFTTSQNSLVRRPHPVGLIPAFRPLLPQLLLGMGYREY